MSAISSSNPILKILHLYRPGSRTLNHASPFTALAPVIMKNNLYPPATLAPCIIPRIQLSYPAPIIPTKPIQFCFAIRSFYCFCASFDIDITIPLSSLINQYPCLIIHVSTTVPSIPYNYQINWLDGTVVET